MSHEPGEPFDARLRRARDGDKSTLDRLIGEQRSWLRGWAGPALGRQMRRWHDPSDVVQETLRRGRQHFGRFRGEGKGGFRAWLRAIQRNVIRSLLRRDLGKLQHEHLISRDDRREKDFSDSASSVVARLDRAEEFRLAKEAVSLLNEDDRSLLEARFLNPGAEDLHYDQLAAELGAKAPQLRQRVRRLLKRLADGVVLLRRLERGSVAQHYRQVLCWQHFRAWPVARIAQELKCPEKAAKTLLANARQQCMYDQIESGPVSSARESWT